MSVYLKCINFIKKVSYIFKNMKFREKGVWKPCQRGMRVLCNGLLGLQEYFLHVRGYEFLMFGTFVQDCVENIFFPNQIFTGSAPRCGFFPKFKSNNSGSVDYDFEESESLPGVDIIAVAREKAKERAQFIYDNVTLPELCSLTILDIIQQYVLYDIPGSVIATIQLSNLNVCFVCLDAAKWNDAVPLQVSVPLPKPVCSCPLVVDSPDQQLLEHDHLYVSPYIDSCNKHGHLVVETNRDASFERNCTPLKEIDKMEKTKEAKEVVVKKPKKTIEFSSADIRGGLQLWVACGATGCDTLVQVKKSCDVRMPARRTLQAATQHLKFASGVLHEVVTPLKAKFQGYTDRRDRDVNIVFDEFVHKRQVDYDSSTRRMIGCGTLPGQENMQKTEIFMFRSVHQRKKQIVGYQQNPSEECASAEKKNFIIELLKMAHEVGANVISLVCDMGNRAMLTELGFRTKKEKIVWCIPNPCSPDPVHLFKSLKESLCNNEEIVLSKEICDRFGLESQVVELKHIEWLEAFQRDDTLQLVPGLTFKDTSSSHFSKMNFGSVNRIFNPRCAASLKYLSASPDNFL
ncbi:hypothetical protein FOCC_FOCC007473 [Frankliniella occidentalis]|nr:hypothetical protein FOCC_FOCC007473 [Frankliniella occidentalis]